MILEQENAFTVVYSQQQRSIALYGAPLDDGADVVFKEIDAWSYNHISIQVQFSYLPNLM